MLYGVDLAKREIARTGRVVVVEGYTDVMACHLAGVPVAVATCGTAFGTDHIRIVRRLLGDEERLGTEVVFTFDGDEAGRKAALRAFDEDQRFVAQTYIAVAADGMDPCELRQARGDEAVKELVESRRAAVRVRDPVDAGAGGPRHRRGTRAGPADRRHRWCPGSGTPRCGRSTRGSSPGGSAWRSRP